MHGRLISAKRRAKSNSMIFTTPSVSQLHFAYKCTYSPQNYYSKINHFKSFTLMPVITRVAFRAIIINTTAAPSANHGRTRKPGPTRFHFNKSARTMHGRAIITVISAASPQSPGVRFVCRGTSPGRRQILVYQSHNCPSTRAIKELQNRCGSATAPFTTPPVPGKNAACTPLKPD